MNIEEKIKRAERTLGPLLERVDICVRFERWIMDLKEGTPFYSDETIESVNKRIKKKVEERLGRIIDWEVEKDTGFFLYLSTP